MKIYTKQGDGGKTQVYAKEVLRLDKDDAILECYGTLDELNAHLGMIEALVAAQTQNGLHTYAQQLQDIQQQLFAIGFALSDNAQLEARMIERLERSIDALSELLSAQTKFILPGGHQISAAVHIARTVARRAERRLVSLSKVHDVDTLALSYVNRLSDYLFVFARFVNHVMQFEDVEV